MVIHVVSPGESVFSIALDYGVPMSQVVLDNGLERSARLVVGQALVIRFPTTVHTVRAGETVYSIARRYGLTLRQLYRNNPILRGDPQIYPGQTLVIAYEEEEKRGTLTVNGYAYPTLSSTRVSSLAPYLTFLTPFTYGFTAQGTLVELDDAALIAGAHRGGAGAVMHLSTLTPEGNFSNELAHLLLNDPDLEEALLAQVVQTMADRDYQGLDVDFEYIYPQDALAYAAFLGRLTQALNPLGYLVAAALAPKTSAGQKGTLYEGHSYPDIAAAVNRVLLMTYEWGYTYGPPMAVAPLPNVRQVVEYALTEMPAEKIWLGVPTYGYDWPLPFVKGQTRARSLSPVEATALAADYGAEIQYDQTSQAPWFRYTDGTGTAHEVWFEDARSIQAKLALIPQYGLDGVGYWNLMRPFPQNWLVLDAQYAIRSGFPLSSAPGTV